jgi:hypothetical protein
MCLGGRLAIAIAGAIAFFAAATFLMLVILPHAS